MPYTPRDSKLIRIKLDTWKRLTNLKTEYELDFTGIINILMDDYNNRKTIDALKDTEKEIS